MLLLSENFMWISLAVLVRDFLPASNRGIKSAVLRKMGKTNNKSKKTKSIQLYEYLIKLSWF